MTNHVVRTAVFHVANQPGDIQRALSAAESLLEAHPDSAIRIIVNGDALAGVTTDADPITVHEGIVVEACEHGLNRRNIASGAIQKSVSTVPSALVEIVAAQWAGAAYARV